LTRTYAVRVAFDDASVPTQLGQSARIIMSTAKDAVLSIPLSALYEADGKAAVWVVDAKDGRIHKRAVSVSRYGAQMAEISEGLGLNDLIVQAGVHLLSEGELVTAVDGHNRPVRLGQPAAKSP
jgi:multidrug efflux system membrane fusion protein